MGKRLVQIVLFCMLLLPLFSVESAAKTLDSVEVDVCIIGGKNHFVYKIPKEVHRSIAYDEMKGHIEKSLSNKWEIQSAHYEVNDAAVEYTFFVENLLQTKQKGQLKLDIPYSVVIGMFGVDEAVQLRIMASKLSDWTGNAKALASIGFKQPLTFLSEREYIYDGFVHELIQQSDVHLAGTINKGQLIVRSIIFFSFVLLQVAACLFLANRFKRSPEKVHQNQKYRYTYQWISVGIILAQVMYIVMSGLMTAFSLYFTPGIDLLLIVSPILLNILVVPMIFVARENKMSIETIDLM